MTNLAKRIVCLASAASIAWTPVSAEDLKSSGIAYISARPNAASSSELARVAISITSSEGAPIKGLTKDNFSVFAFCGGFIVKADALNFLSFDSQGRPVESEGDYVFSADLRNLDKDGTCKGFIVKVFSREGSSPGAPTFTPRLSTFIPLI